MYLGDIRLGETLDCKFTTRRFSTGAPFTLAGTPAVSAYVGNSTTEITAGITLTVDFDTRTGLNHVRVVATSGNGFATATNVQLVITAGTVDSVSVVGEVIGEFSIENRSALMPTVAARTLDVSAGGEAGLDWANIGSPTTAQNLSATNIDVDQIVASVSGAVGSVTTVSSGAISEASYATTAGSFAPLGIVDQGTAQSATGTTVVLRAASAFADSTLVGSAIMVLGSDQGYWQTREITANVLSTDTVTVDAWTVTPTGTITYKVLACPPALTTLPQVTLANGAHGGAAAVLTFSQLIGATDANKDCVSFTGSGTGSALRLIAGTKNAILVTATGDDAVHFETTDAASAGFNLIGGASSTGMVGTITGTLSGNVGGVAANGITAASIATDAITAAKIAADAIGASELAADAVAEIATAVLTTVMTESYRSANATGTVAQLLYEVIAHLGESSIAGTTKTLKKLDGTTTAKTYTLNSATTPTAITETT